MRSRAELRASSEQQQNFASQLQNLRDTNHTLERDLQKLTNDPSAIELAARERLGMVRANDVVVTRQSLQLSGNGNKDSLVR
jgi:cell division protein FtsB